MAVELRCRQCGARFIPTRADLLREPAWHRLRSRCRSPQVPHGSERREARSGYPMQCGNAMSEGILHERHIMGWPTWKRSKSARVSVKFESASAGLSALQARRLIHCPCISLV